MTAIGSLIILLGIGIAILGGIFFLLQAFKESILWGLAVLFISPASLVFLILYWPVAKKPFFLQLWGLGFILLGALVFNAKLPFTG